MLILDEELLRRSRMISGAIEELLPVVHPRGSTPPEGIWSTPEERGSGRACFYWPPRRSEATLRLSSPPPSRSSSSTTDLIHDDIMDNAGDPPREARGPRHVGRGGGDPGWRYPHLLGLRDPGPPRRHSPRRWSLVKMLAKTCAAICEGQWPDMEFERRDEVTEAEYLEMIEKKTGVLYGAAGPGCSARLAAALWSRPKGWRGSAAWWDGLPDPGRRPGPDGPAKVLGKPRGGGTSPRGRRP